MRPTADGLALAVRDAIPHYYVAPQKLNEATGRYEISGQRCARCLQPFDSAVHLRPAGAPRRRRHRTAEAM